MFRRNFLKSAGGLLALNPLSMLTAKNRPAHTVKMKSAVPPSSLSSVQVTNNQVVVDTSTLHAVLDNGFLVSLKSKAGGEEFINAFDKNDYSALQLIFLRDDTADFNDKSFNQVSLNQVSGNRAEIIFHCWYGDGVITVTADDETGDLVIEPSAYTSRPGVLACRWNLQGMRPDLQLVAPFFQGIRMKLDDPLLADSRWTWPFYWEAGLAILQSKNRGFYVHSRDTAYRYKALKTGSKSTPYILGLDSEAYGPVDNNLSAGGLSWRLNVYEGDWPVAAATYRDWLWGAYNLGREEQLRPSWMNNVKFAISWCPGDPAVLDALAKKIDPSKVLVHFPEWRKDIYDQNYPDYIASEKGKAFIAKGRQMGFHIMPHFNANDMDPSNPVYAMVRDFQYRDLEKKNILGWSWLDGRVLNVPESNESRLHNRDKNVMVKIHPGLTMWRSILGERVQQAAADLVLETVFLDVTLVTPNLYNCLVESTTPSEGMKKLIAHIGELGNGLVVGGEGLNEITMQGLTFAQAHLFKSWQVSVNGLERTGGCNLNQVLFGKLSRIIGYSGMSGKNKDEEMRMQIHLEHGGIPTIVIDSADEIVNPNPAVRRMLEIANNS